MCLDKFLDFPLKTVLAEFLENEQVIKKKKQSLIKVNTMQTLIYAP